MSNTVLLLDKQRYLGGGTEISGLVPKSAGSSKSSDKKICRKLYNRYRAKRCIEIDAETQIGAGLYFGHAYCITINPKAVLGRNINLHKGVTIGQENRGKRKGTPVIGDNVWIGVNATIVGSIHVGSDVLIAPNSYVNCDVPDHSIVFGNPCIIKHSDFATENYVNRAI